MIKLLLISMAAELC